ncbi:MAG: hypothetical protein WAV41_00260 [Microgenomates group bacterium]
MPNPLNRDHRSPVYNSFGAEGGIPLDPPVGREMVVSDAPAGRGDKMMPMGGGPPVVDYRVPQESKSAPKVLDLSKLK